VTEDNPRNKNFHVRLAVEDDLASITSIYNQAIELKSATADISPVSVSDRNRWFSEHGAEKYPVFVADSGEAVLGYCSLSAYRPGRMALRHTAEISYYVHEDYRGLGVASALIQHAIDACSQLEIRTLFAILLDVNTDSIHLLEKFNFEKWGHMPGVADFDGRECDHLYFGRRLSDENVIGVIE